MKKKIFRIIGVFIIIGIIMNIIAIRAYPELSEKFPVIFDFFDGWLQVAEFLCRSVIGAVYALFSGQFSEFWSGFITTAEDMISQFWDWLEAVMSF